MRHEYNLLSTILSIYLFIIYFVLLLLLWLLLLWLLSLLPPPLSFSLSIAFFFSCCGNWVATRSSCRIPN